MKIVLVPNPNPRYKNGIQRAQPYAPLGLISIGTILKKRYDTVILDINHLVPDLKCEIIAEFIIRECPDIIGFSTMCNQYMKTIKIAKKCKCKKPNVKIMFGGPQATITDKDTLLSFEFIDVIVKGESEWKIIDVVHALDQNMLNEGIPGITYRENGEIIQTQYINEIEKRKFLPELDYGMYPNVKFLERVPVEVGRGCPFECTFCSTNLFWNRSWYLHPIDRLIGTIDKIYSKYGITNFSFEHDNMTVSRERVIELCNAIKKKCYQITWGCSARIDCLDEELINTMASAGCTRIFIGVETGSSRMQKIIKKRLNLAKLPEVIRNITDSNIDFTASFIIGFPDEKIEDISDTIKLMGNLRVAGKGKEIVQLHMLAPAPGTELFIDYWHNLKFDGNFSDYSMDLSTEEELDVIYRNRNIFSSFYYFDSKHISRDTLKRIQFVIASLAYQFPYTFFILSRETIFCFPKLIIDNFIFLKIPEKSHPPFDRIEDTEIVSEFIIDSVIKKGFSGHFILDIIKYETVAHKISSSAEEEQTHIEAFHFDVEDIFDRINKSIFNAESIINKTNYVLFMKKENSIATLKLPSELFATDLC